MQPQCPTKSCCPIKNRFILFILFLVVYAVCFFWVDKPLAMWAHQTLATTPIYSFSVHIESLASPGHWTGVAILAGLMGLFLKFRHRESAKYWLFFAGSVLVATVICFILKTVLGRYRPVEWFNAQLYGFHGFSRQHDLNSSPSGHVVSAMSGLLSIALIFKKRILTLLLMAIVFIIALSRVAMTAHYLGDVIFGAYVGMISVYWVRSCLKL